MFQIYKKNDKDLDSFSKNKKRKQIITVSVIGIILIVGTITIFRTFAFYEEKSEFDVLNGRIPSHWYDLNLLSIKVEGQLVETIPNRAPYKVNVECSNGRADWDYISWSLNLTELKENTKCTIEFTKTLSDAEYKTYLISNKVTRRNTYRGKDITEYYNDGSLYEMISNGTFDDIYVGDYIIANGVTWLIADIDNYLNSGDQNLSRHHATIIPAKPLMNTPMNATHTTEGGYIGSKMVKETLASLVTSEGIIGKTFGSHILEYRNILTNQIKNDATNQSGGIFSGASNNWTWFTRMCDLMSEVNIYGTTVWSTSGHDTGIDNRQYAIFQLKPEFINSYGTERFHYWLKSLSGNTTYTHIGVDSYAGGYWGSAANSVGVRPRFLIG